MAIGDFLSTVGKAAVPVLERTAQVVSGEAPQIDAEKRRRQEALEDAEINSKASILENNLAMGQKYGTLTPDQQKQYIDEITGLYSHPRHSATLMEKLRKAIHPHGAFAQGPQAPLANPVPEGGTAAQDEQSRESALADAIKLRQTATDEEIERRAKATAANRKPIGKSPPLPGNQLPTDAIGPSGQPIGEADRNAGRSFVEFNGSWWPVAKAKPVFKTVRGHSVLVDGQSGTILRDLGPTGTAKVTTRQTLQPGDDGQMHLVNLTSVTTPEGATIDVQPEEQGAAEPKAGPQEQPSTPAKKVNPASILPRTGAKPATSTQGPVVSGLSTLARSKSPIYKADVQGYSKAQQDANAKAVAYQSAVQASKAPTPTSDQELIYSWVRSNVQGAGRMTQAEFNQAKGIGSVPLKIENWISLAQSGEITPQMRQYMLADIKRSAEISAAEATKLKNQLGAPATQAQPTGSGDSAVEQFLMKLGK